MSYLRQLLRPTEQRAYAPDDDFWYTNLGTMTASGVRMTPELALTLSAVFCAVRLLAESVAQLPLKVYRRLSNGGRELATEHPNYKLLHDQPNEEQTSFEWREMLEGHLVLRGVALSQIERRRNGEISALIPLHPDSVRIERPNRTGPLVYWRRLRDGAETMLRRDQVMHLTGMSVVTLARESFASMLATGQFGSAHFKNQTRPSGVLEYPGKLKPEALATLKKSWHETYGGPANTGKTVILEEGMKWSQVGMTAEDAQYLQSRKFDIAEVARWFNLPPHMLKDMQGGASFASIEQMSIEFVLYALMPWLVRWEQAIQRDLFDESERNLYFASFLVDGLLRGDTLTRSQALAIKRQNGVINADEWRAIDNENPQPDGQGQAYLVPLNMVPADRLDDVEPKPAGVPTTAAGSEDSRAIQAGEQRSAKARRRIQRAYRRVFADAAGRIVTREVKSVREAAKKMLTTRTSQEFDRWLLDFYATNGDHRKFIARTMRAPASAMAELIQGEAAAEIGVTIKSAAELEQFVSEYVETMSLRYIESSRGQLVSVLAEAEADKALDEIEKRLAEWLDKRPEKIGDRETVQLGNAVARETYKDNGIQRMKWQTTGEKTCPICDNMAGRTVLINDAFAMAGEKVGDLNVKSTKTHPPLHDGCDCSVVPA